MAARLASVPLPSLALGDEPRDPVDGLTTRERALVDELFRLTFVEGQRASVGDVYQRVFGCAESGKSVGAASAMARPQVRAALRERFDAVLATMLPTFLHGLLDLATRSKSEYVRLEATNKLIERAMGKVADRVDVTAQQAVSISINMGADPSTSRAQVLDLTAEG